MIELDLTDERATYIWCVLRNAVANGTQATKDQNFAELARTFGWVDAMLDEIQGSISNLRPPTGSETGKGG